MSAAARVVAEAASKAVSVGLRRGPRPKPAIDGRVRVWILNIILALVAVTLWHTTVRFLPMPPAPLHIPWWALAVGFFASEVYVVHVQFRREAYSYSLAEIVLVLGLFFASPAQVMLGQVVGTFLALGVHRRQAPLKLTFNVLHFFVEGCVAAILFHSLAVLEFDIGSLDWGAAFVATTSTSVIGVVLIFLAISLSEGVEHIQNLPRAMAFGLIVAFTNTSLGLAGVTLVWRDTTAGWLLMVPAATLFLAYRAYSGVREKHESLEFLYESSRIIQRSPQTEGAMLALLSQARKTFRTEIAELCVYPTADSGAPLRTGLRPEDDLEVMKQMPAGVADALWARIAAAGQPLLVSRSDQDADLARYFDGAPFHDAIVAPLRGETRIFGFMLLANRLGDVGTFDEADLKLFETLASHISVTLENGRLEQSLAQLTELEDQLKHQAFHDPLTGLPNRVLFSERVQHALTSSQRTGNSTAVLFVDLDDFKTINDSLGHEAGDTLLREVAARVRNALRPEDTAARLGGDEFAVLVENTTELGASAVAERILASLRPAARLNGTEVFVHASIGVALATSDCDTADLLRNADVAMYIAKAQGKGNYRMFEDSMHAAAIERLELKAAMQAGIARDEFVLLYQPTFSLKTGEMTGAEALVRWHHPERGVVSPADFIPLAEETGLVVPIGKLVLREACHQAQEWRVRFPDAPPLSMAVNLSARQLLQDSLVGDVAAALRASKLEPGLLTLEITESILMQDAEAACEKLRALKALGILLAIDDFGTGYSSLSYLQRFPVDILKIDKAFVGDLASADGSSLAKAIVGIATNLRLSTVAEGIERDEQRARLKEMGCDTGQGYLYAPPLERAVLEEMLGERSARYAAAGGRESRAGMIIPGVAYDAPDELAAS